MSVCLLSLVLFVQRVVSACWNLSDQNYQRLHVEKCHGTYFSDLIVRRIARGVWDRGGLGFGQSLSLEVENLYPC